MVPWSDHSDSSDRVKKGIILVFVIFVSWFGLGVRLVSGGTLVRIGFGFPFSSKVVVCGHCLVTLSLTVMKH